MASAPITVDFDAQPDDEESPCAFRLGGREWHCRSADGVAYVDVEHLVEPTETPREQFERTKLFFNLVLIEGEGEDFGKMLSDPDAKITLGKLAAVSEYVQEYVFKRPPTPPAT